MDTELAVDSGWLGTGGRELLLSPVSTLDAIELGQVQEELRVLTSNSAADYMFNECHLVSPEQRFGILATAQNCDGASAQEQADATGGAKAYVAQDLGGRVLGMAFTSDRAARAQDWPIPAGAARLLRASHEQFFGNAMKHVSAWVRSEPGYLLRIAELSDSYAALLQEVPGGRAWATMPNTYPLGGVALKNAGFRPIETKRRHEDGAPLSKVPPKSTLFIAAVS